MITKEETRCENCIVRQLNSLKVLKRDELATISDSKVTRSFKKGEHIYQEGDRLDGVYCVRDGVSKVTKASSNGKDQIIKLAGKGSLLGQRSLFAGEHSQLGAVALHDTELCFIPKQTMDSAIEDNMVFMKAALKFISAELNVADNIIADMAQKSVDQRLASALLYLQDQFGTDSDGYVSLVLTRQDIASLIGTVKEVCIRKLKYFATQSWVETDGKRIKITNAKALYQLMEDM